MALRLLFLSLVSLAFAPLHADEPPFRIACLGDSITAGAQVKAATESYPAQLQQMLGERWVVKNFGLGGATMWHGGKPNAAQELPGATAFAPQIAIVMFGINDTRSRDVNYWAHFDEFEQDARHVLETLLALPTHPKIILCGPTANRTDLPGMPAERIANVTERLPRLAEVRAKVDALAKAYAGRGVSPVDLWAVTEPHPELFVPDGCHLKAPGYRALAEALRPKVLELGQAR